MPTIEDERDRAAEVLAAGPDLVKLLQCRYGFTPSEAAAGRALPLRKARAILFAPPANITGARSAMARIPSASSVAECDERIEAARRELATLGGALKDAWSRPRSEVKQILATSRATVRQIKRRIYRLRKRREALSARAL